MDTIFLANKLIEKALGSQPIKMTKYRPLTYLLSHEVNDGILIYNFMTGALIYLPQDEKAFFLNNDEEIFNTVREKLISSWFLVPVDNDDVLLSNQVNKLMRSIVDSIKHPPITNFTIFPTTDCDARCFYCFELYRNRMNMSPKVAEDVAEFIFTSSKGNPVTIRWFGGEPLYNSEAIDIISEKLRNKGVEFYSSIVTNGYLFNAENIHKAKSIWNISRAQITLDGTEEVYNRIKAYIYKNGLSPFKVVMKNIKALLESGIYVSIRLNVDDHNIDDLYSLVDFLSVEFGEYSNFSVYAHLLFEYSTKKQINRTDSERHILMQRFFLFEDYIESKNIAWSRGVDKMLRFKQCMMDNNAATTILPDGHLGKCEHFTEDNFWGSIYESEIDEELIEKFKQIETREGQCDLCPIKPACLQLTHCPDVPKHCDEYDRMMQHRNIKKFIITEYKKYLKSKEKENEA